MNPLKSILTGADNESLAIGRVLGAAAFIALIVGLPALIAGVLLNQKVEPKVWFEYLAALQIYAPIMIAAIGAVIAGTAFTEPKPRL